VREFIPRHEGGIQVNLEGFGEENE